MAKAHDIPAPRENPRLFGHEQAEQRFVQEFAGGKTHHAYLMTGPKGIGKATLAYRFARHILATGAVQAKAFEPEEQGGFSLFGDAPVAPPPAAASLNAGPEDAMFRRIAAGSHTDLLTISPAFDKKKDAEKTIISVEEARKVPEFLSLTPAESAWRVVIIDAVDQLNTSSANALLKILEEPPAQAILLLVCHEAGGILPTIKSRCRKFALAAPARTDFDKALAAVAPAIEPGAYSALHALSNGSPGLAITLDAQGGAQWYQHWLGALNPSATAAERQKFVDNASAQKSPDAWRAILHGWQVACSRIGLWPYSTAPAIVPGEAELIAAIAGPLSPQQREAWGAQARSLLTVTDIFNLDKRQTLAMLLRPDLLASVAA